MKKSFLLVFIILTIGSAALAQNKAAIPGAKPMPSPAVQARNSESLDLAEYGVSFQPDPRLIVVMAALDAAGFDPTPTGREPSFFRTQIRKDLARLDPGLRQRLRTFYARTKLLAPATPADEAARYVSLAYTLGPAPEFTSPERSDDLPGAVLEVLDFASLVREFYRKSGIDERLASYMRAYQAEGDRLRQPTGEMVNTVLSYLHMRPALTVTERVPVKSPGKKKDKTETYSIREHERHFYVVPDLLAAPGAINFRIIVDDYYTIVPEGTNPEASEMRRAYAQYVIDPVVRRYNREIAARREQIKLLLNERAKAGGTVSPDVFLTVARSLVAAADARLEERMRLDALQDNIRRRLAVAKDEAARARITQESQAARVAIADETVADLAGDYEKGAVLAFFFAGQLRDLESAGFGFSDFFADMIASFDPAREARRPADYAAAVTRAAAARKAHPRYTQWMTNPGAVETSAADPVRNSGLVKGLSEVEKLRQLKNYEEAEARLRSLLQEFPGDARILFTMGQTASLWARDSTDDELQTQRLNRALANYRLAVAAALPDADRALLSHAHEAMGRILAFQDNDAEAVKEFDAAISLGDVPGGAYKDAVAGKQKIGLPK
ncbi:MAG: hypothetical protein QOD75_2616 [Blastocatellia bacterium]|jgi:tetratricopeptide (TPR) repeat protein|nr:hypothetical protein [Blastocatellia bacterium]